MCWTPALSSLELPQNFLVLKVGASFSTSSGDLVVRAGSSEVVFPGYQSVYGSKFFRNAQEDMAAHKSEQNTLLSSLQVRS